MQNKKISRKLMPAALCAVLASSLVLTGGGDVYGAAQEAGDGQESGEKDTKDAAMGRYLEETVEIPEEYSYFLALQELEDATLRLVGMKQEGGLFLADSSDGGKSWEEKDFLKEEEISLYESVMGTVIGKDGAVFLQTRDYTKANEAQEQGQELSYEEQDALAETCWYYVDAQGKGKKVPVDEEKSKAMVMMLNGVMGEDGMVYFTSVTGGITKMNPATGEILQTIEEGNQIINFALLGKELLLVTYDQVLFYDAETGKPVEGDAALSEEIMSDKRNLQVFSISSFPIVFTQGAEPDTLFYLNKNGVFCHAMGGSITEKVIDGTLNSLGSPDTAVSGFTMAKDGSFYVTAANGAGEKVLFHYVYSKDTPAVPDKELNVYSMNDNNMIRQAITLYQKEHPDIYVKLEAGVSGEDGVTDSDALKNLNTEIMAGKGPDLILLDGINAENYEEKGILLDIQDVLAQVQEEEGLLENIVNAYTREDGSIYEIPLSFGIPIVEGEKDIVEGITDLASFAEGARKLREKYPEAKAIVSDANLNILFYEILVANSRAWMKEDGSLDEEKITEFFQLFKEIYDMDQHEGEGDDYYTDMSKLSRTDIGYYGLSMLAKTKYLNAATLYNPRSGSMLFGVGEQMENDAYKQFNGQAENCFVPCNIVGINSLSQNAETAKDFLGFLLSSKTQGTNKDLGFPINKTVYEDSSFWGVGTGEFNSYTISSTNNLTGVSVELNLKDLTEEQAKELQDMGKNLTVPAQLDSVLIKTMETELKKYVLEGVSLEESVRAVMQQMNLYLSE